MFKESNSLKSTILGMLTVGGFLVVILSAGMML